MEEKLLKFSKLEIFQNLIEEIDYVSARNLILTSEILKKIKVENKFSKDEKKEIISYLIENIKDSACFAGKKNQVYECIMNNNFENYLILQEIWFGDYYNIWHNC